MAPSIRSFRTSNRPPPSSYRAPPSPTLSATTSASQLDFEDGPRVIVTRADLRESVSAYEQLLASAKGYRQALIALSAASTALAGAMGECARVKGAGDSGEGLLAASGLHYMVANSGQVLSDTLYRSFEVPLMTAYDSYVGEIAARHAEYETLLAEKTAAIRETEAENIRQGKKKNRDLNQFRIALAKLTEQVAEVDVCKKSYYSEVLENETEMWSMIGGKVSLLVRSTLDLADRLASKATSDPVIESMLNEHPDPFDSYRLETDEARDVFTILPPINLSIAGSSHTSPIAARRAAAAAADSDKETVRSREKEREPEDSNLTPRKGSKSNPASVSEILGLNQTTDDEDEPQLRSPPAERRRPAAAQDAPARTDSIRTDSLPSSPLHSRQPSHTSAYPAELAQSSHQQPLTTSAAATTSSSAPSSPPTPAPDSPALTPASEAADPTNHFGPDAPSLTTESAPFATLSHSSAQSHSSPSGLNASVSSFSPQKGATRRSRGLSRVSEDAVDEMAGDWSGQDYGRQLSPAGGLNGGGGYDSGEEEVGGWRG
ncbi:hypothetical protein JCM8547_001756 [Rhodosporidiobolus lusitaniae]